MKNCQYRQQIKKQKMIDHCYFPRVKHSFFYEQQQKNTAHKQIQQRQLVILKSQNNQQIISYFINFCFNLVTFQQQKRIQIINSIKKELTSPSLNLNLIQNAPKIYYCKHHQTQSTIQSEKQAQKNFTIVDSNQHFKILVLQIFNQLLQIPFFQFQKKKQEFSLTKKIWQILKNKGIILIIIFIRSILYLIFQVDEALWYYNPIRKQVLTLHLDNIFYPHKKSRRSSRVNGTFMSQSINQIFPQILVTSQIITIQQQKPKFGKKFKTDSNWKKNPIFLSQNICYKDSYYLKF